MRDFHSYVGGCNLPMKGGVGRVSLDRPLARLEIHPRRVSFHARGPFRFVFPSRSLPLPVIGAAFPIARVLFSGSGIGLDCVDGAYYFWTRQADEILALLEWAGVPVEPTPRRVSLRSLTWGRGNW